jgi:hypothetical protein
MISSHGWGRELGSSQRLHVKSCGKCVRDGGERLEKKNHACNMRLEKRIKTNRNFGFETIKNNQVRKKDLVI